MRWKKCRMSHYGASYAIPSVGADSVSRQLGRCLPSGNAQQGGGRNRQDGLRASARHPHCSGQDGAAGHRAAERVRDSITEFIEGKLKLKVNREKIECAYIGRLKYYLQGWVEYFDYADMGNKVKDIDQWLRRRLRMCIWKSWKKPRTRVKNLIRCGIDRWQAYQWGNTSKGYWRIADSWILSRAIGDESLHKAGYSWIGCYYSASALPKG